jgi:hypothetical protein
VDVTHSINKDGFIMSDNNGGFVKFAKSVSGSALAIYALYLRSQGNNVAADELFEKAKRLFDEGTK